MTEAEQSEAIALLAQDLMKKFEPLLKRLNKKYGEKNDPHYPTAIITALLFMTGKYVAAVSQSTELDDNITRAQTQLRRTTTNSFIVFREAKERAAQEAGDGVDGGGTV